MFIYYILRDMIRDIHELPDEENTWGKIGKDPKCRSSCYHGLVMDHPPGTQMCSATRKHAKPHIFGIFMEASSQRHDRSLTQSLAPFPFPEVGMLDLKVPSCKSWFDLSGNQPPFEAIRDPIQSHLIRTRHSYHPGNSKVFRSSVLGTGLKDQIREQKMF